MGNKRDLSKHKAIFSLEGANQNSVNIQGKVEIRGKLRRSICDLLPLKLHFSKKDLDAMDLNRDFNSLKLVTQCRFEEDSDQYVMKEYWTYQLYNLISPNSFKVHLMNVTYVHEERPKEQIKTIAFIIESNKELAARLGAELKEKWGGKKTEVVADSYYKHLLFQYMIGNTDWDVATQKNLKLLNVKGDSLSIIIPYDFDYSALVHTPYARINHSKYPEQKTLEQRVVINHFEEEEMLTATANHFLQLKDAILQSYKKCERTDKKQKVLMNLYLKSFFKEIGNKKKREALFLKE